MARVQSNLGFRVPGKIVERMVNTGDFVRRGQPLMRIDRADSRSLSAAQDAAVASAKARAIQTAADEARYRTLLDPGLLRSEATIRPKRRRIRPRHNYTRLRRRLRKRAMKELTRCSPRMRMES